MVTRREFLTRGISAAAGGTLLGRLGLALAEDKPSTARASVPIRREKPSILYVFADQMRNCNLGCMGNPDVKTPNMDKLARQGMLFSNATSGFPLCSPYRAMLLTGRYPLSTGVITNNIKLPSSEVTIAKVLKAQGYKTGYVGKWHLDGNVAADSNDGRQGFDFWQSGAVKELPKTKSDYKPDTQTDVAIQFMKEHAAEPFCLFLSWTPPHPPYIAPKRYETLYDPKKLKLRENVQGNIKEAKDELSKSYAMITGLDDNIGKLMKALDDLNLAEDTIFCFSSDHGDMLWSHGKENKNLPWEESINVPFIMRYPRAIKAGQKSDVLLNSVHVVPTLLGLANVEVPKVMEGEDLSQVILGKGGPATGSREWRDKEPESAYILDVIPGPSGLKTGTSTWRGVRTKRYTYAKMDGKGWLLFDRERDPYEMDNLIDKPEAKELQDKMEATLQEWLKKTGDKFEPIDVWWERIGGTGKTGSAKNLGKRTRNPKG